MLLYYLLLHVMISLFGDATWVMRLPSLLADATTGGLVVVIGLRLLATAPGGRGRPADRHQRAARVLGQDARGTH